MVHKHFPVKVSIIIRIHNESTGLSQAIEVRRMSMEFSIRLHFREADTTCCFQALAINDYFLNRTIVLVEFLQGMNHLVHHGTVESLCFARLDALAHFVKTLLNLGAFCFSS